jgi:hypothetical protein
VNIKPVKSSTITHVGYDPAARKMQVHFKNGGKYVYHDVSPADHDALVEADSIGSHFAGHIRDRFRTTKL